MDRNSLIGMLIGAGVASTLAAGAWFLAESRPAESREYVAKIGLETITVSEFREEMARRGGNIPGQYRTVEQRQALLDAMIEQRLLLAGAKAAGFDRDPEVLRAAEKFMIDRYRTAALSDRLASVAVTDDEVRSYYEDHRETYATPAQRRGAIIEMNLSPRASEAYRQKVYDRVETVMRGIADLPDTVSHFGALARRYSEDRSTRYQGGVIGWLEENPRRPYKWGDEVLRALYRLENIGDVSEPIQVEDKLYLVRLVESKDKAYRPFERVEAGIKQLLTRQRKEEIESEFLASIQEIAPVETNLLALQTMGPLSGPKAEEDRRPPAVPGTAR